VTTRSSCCLLRCAVIRPCLWLVVLSCVAVLAPHLLPEAHAAFAAKKLKPSDPYALIFGTVWGPDNRAAYGVKVVIRRASDKKTKWELFSDHAGEFAQRVPAGKSDYIVTAYLKGVKTQDGHALHLEEDVPVHVEYDERVDIGLHLAQ
jgi:hypothetical protein